MTFDELNKIMIEKCGKPIKVHNVAIFTDNYASYNMSPIKYDKVTEQLYVYASSTTTISIFFNNIFVFSPNITRETIKFSSIYGYGDIVKLVKDYKGHDVNGLERLMKDNL